MDAGTFGTMGVGCGFAIAAALLEQQKLPSQQAPVLCIQGDSAFGFSGMEVETAHRYYFTHVVHTHWLRMRSEVYGSMHVWTWSATAALIKLMKCKYEFLSASSNVFFDCN